MLLVLQKGVFIENEASQQCVTMRKRFSTIMATIWYNSFLTKYLSCREQKCVTPLQSVISRKREVPQPHVIVDIGVSTFPLSCQVPPLTSTNCPSPSFLGNLPLYIGFSRHTPPPSVKLDLSVNLKNIKVFYP